MDQEFINESVKAYWDGQVNEVAPKVIHALWLLTYHPDGVQSLVEAQAILSKAADRLEQAFD